MRACCSPTSKPPALLFAQLNSLPYAARVRTRRLDWRADHLGERFDLILGADILYERKQWDFLEPFWRAHLAPGAISAPRRTGPQDRRNVHRLDPPAPLEPDRVRPTRPDCRPKPVRIFQLRPV